MTLAVDLLVFNGRRPYMASHLVAPKKWKGEQSATELERAHPLVYLNGCVYQDL